MSTNGGWGLYLGEYQRWRKKLGGAAVGVATLSARLYISYDTLYGCCITIVALGHSLGTGSSTTSIRQSLQSAWLTCGSLAYWPTALLAPLAYWPRWPIGPAGL